MTGDLDIEQPVTAVHQCIAAIPGVMAERTYPTVAAAGQALWAVLRTLPLGWDQAEAYRALLHDPGLLAGHLARGPQRLAFVMDGRSREVRLAYAG
ncbi:hypothetical protein HUT16_26000 [Kitasatospora sp. NA04385]|uniref:hypothetical protein n=1 Tax=Kitasatospora sp. NA04385 TaxID=2742135 RepID=UPI0015910C5C|nr:hypothetical protein [Kitasatospora sp. NA04385]QKW22059.1 hypothetical protein HUT16_26000 [Kitasatospora sp. NA04385]